jgi:hypothetical protein
MVASVGSISVDLAVRSSKFESDFRKAGATVEKESARMAAATKRASGVIGGLFTGIATGAALAGVASLSGALAKAGKALRDFDDIADTSRTLGLTTKAFQTLGFAALEAGVSQEKLNSSLGIFAKNVGLAKTGQGALVAGLKELNPELLRNIVNADSQAERLNIVADAMQRAGSATERAALATTIFGKGGLEMVRILEKGAAGLGDFAKRAEALGIIVPDDVIQRAGQLADQLDIITKAVDINLSVALAELGPILVAAAGGMLQFATDIRGTSAAISALVSSPSWKTFTNFINSPGGIGASLVEGGVLDKIRDAIVGRAVPEIEADIAKLKTQILDLIYTARREAGEGGILHGIAGRMNAEAIADAKQQLAELEAELEEAGGAAVDAGESGQQAFDRFGNAVGGSTEKVEDLDAAINGLDDKLVTINVRTVQTSGGPVNVTSFGGNSSIPTNPLTNPIGSKPGKFIDPLGGYDTFASGGYTGNAPSDRIAGVVHGGEFVFDADSTKAIGADNLEAIRKGVRGYATGGAVGTATTLTGGQSVLSMIEDNTYEAMMELRRIIPYLDTLVTDEQATLAAIRDLQGSIGGLGRAMSSPSFGGSGGSVSGGTSSSGGGFGGGSSMENPFRYVGGVFYPGSGGFDWRNYNAFQGGFQQQRTGLDGFAAGGIAYEPSIFGEAGPEAAVPLISGKIPVEIKGSGGSGTVHVHYHAAQGNPEPSPRAMMEMQDRVRQTLRANPI